MKYKEYFKYLKESSSTKEFYIKTLIARSKTRFPDADVNEVYVYCMSNSSGVTIKQLETDANEKNWNSDTIRAIYFVLSKIKTKSIKK